MNLNREKTDIKKLMKIYVSMFESIVESRGLSIKLEDKTGKVTGEIDRKLFESAIFNLISNAIKFTPQKGIITITLEKDEDHFYIKIKDTGIGIPEDKLEAIFERFSQVDEESSRKYEGTGIGLSLTKEIIELHGGTISVESKINHGSVFTIKLQLDKNIDDKKIREIENIDKEYLADLQIDKKTIEKKSEHDIPGIKNILLLEDNIGMQDFIISQLKGKYNVIAATNGIEGLKRLTEMKRPDLIISDIMMPDMDGKEFYRRLKALDNFKNIPFIYLTARAGDEEKIEGLEDGAIDYIEKPFDRDVLFAKINSVIASYDEMNREMLLNIINEARKKLTNQEDNKNDNSEIYNKFKITGREKELIELLSEGIENKEISIRLGISVNTVNNHIQKVYKKLGISNRVELIKALKN